MGEEPEVVIEEFAYDGASFFEGIQGNPFYTAYSSTNSQSTAAIGVHSPYLEPLLAWAKDPFRILRFPGTVYDVAELGSSVTQITESYPQILTSGGTGTTITTVDSASGVSHVTRIDVLNDQGDLVWRRDFSDYRTVAEGLWRPYSTVERYYGYQQSEPWLIKTTRVSSARYVAQPEVDAEWWRPQSESDWWFVHE